MNCVSSIHKVIWTCLGGRFFPDTVYIAVSAADYNSSSPQTKLQDSK